MVTILEHSSHPSPPNASARSGAESEQLSIAVFLICQSDGAHDCTCVEPRALLESLLREISLPIGILLVRSSFDDILVPVKSPFQSSPRGSRHGNHRKPPQLASSGSRKRNTRPGHLCYTCRRLRPLTVPVVTGVFNTHRVKSSQLEFVCLHNEAHLHHF